MCCEIAKPCLHIALFEIFICNDSPRTNAPALNCHHPPPGLAFGEPEDRLQRVIRYSTSFRD
jgi:hypothetical protein